MAEDNTHKSHKNGGKPPSSGDGHQRRNQRPRRDAGERRWSDRPKRDGAQNVSRDGDQRPRRNRAAEGATGGSERRWSERPPRDGSSRRDGAPRTWEDRPRKDSQGRPRRSEDRPRNDGESRPRKWEERPKREGAPRDGAPRKWEERPKRDGTSRDGGTRKWEDRPRRDGDRPSRDAGPRKFDDRPRRNDRSQSFGERRFDDRPRRDSGPRKFDDRPRRDFSSDDRYRDREDDQRPRRDEPSLPEDLQLSELDKGARAELKGLSKENADVVAAHLIMAARLVDESPELAHKHALAASQRAGRIAVVRETLGITAYLTEDYALALRELRTFRRISGSNAQLPLMVDSERGLGRLDQALGLAREVDRATLPREVRVQLAIALSGVRLDQGDAEGALRELAIPELDANRAYSFSPELYSAYATVLEDLDRQDEAERWFALADVAAKAIEEQFDDEMTVVEEFVPLDSDLQSDSEDNFADDHSERESFEASSAQLSTSEETFSDSAEETNP